MKLVFGILRKNKAFSILELIFVVAIMGLMATIFIPNLAWYKKKELDKQFISGINYLTQLGWDRATLTNTNHRILFDFNNQTISLEKQNGENYQKLDDTYFDTEVEFNGIDVKNFFINGIDEMVLKGDEIKKDTIWFYIVPNGITQNVTINYDFDFDQRTTENSLVINPFLAKFSWMPEYAKA